MSIALRDNHNNKHNKEKQMFGTKSVVNRVSRVSIVETQSKLDAIARRQAELASAKSVELKEANSALARAEWELGLPVDISIEW